MLCSRKRKILASVNRCDGGYATLVFEPALPHENKRYNDAPVVTACPTGATLRFTHWKHPLECIWAYTNQREGWANSTVRAVKYKTILEKVDICFIWPRLFMLDYQTFQHNEWTFAPIKIEEFLFFHSGNFSRKISSNNEPILQKVITLVRVFRKCIIPYINSNIIFVILFICYEFLLRVYRLPSICNLYHFHHFTKGLKKRKQKLFSDFLDESILKIK